MISVKDITSILQDINEALSTEFVTSHNVNDLETHYNTLLTNLKAAIKNKSKSAAQMNDVQSNVKETCNILDNINKTKPEHTCISIESFKNKYHEVDDASKSSRILQSKEFETNIGNSHQRKLIYMPSKMQSRHINVGTCTKKDACFSAETILQSARKVSSLSIKDNLKKSYSTNSSSNISSSNQRLNNTAPSQNKQNKVKKDVLPVVGVVKTSLKTKEIELHPNELRKPYSEINAFNSQTLDKLKSYQEHSSKMNLKVASGNEIGSFSTNITAGHCENHTKNTMVGNRMIDFLQLNDNTRNQLTFNSRRNNHKFELNGDHEKTISSKTILTDNTCYFEESVSVDENSVIQLLD